MGLSRLLYGTDNIQEYPGITLTGECPGKVYFGDREWQEEVTHRHWLLCLQPMVYGIWMPGNAHPWPAAGTYSLLFTDGKKKKLAKHTLQLSGSVREQDGCLLLLKVTHTRIHHTWPAECRFLYYRYFRKPGTSFSRFKALAAAYSYPRNVKMICFREDDHYNIFPMDLTGHTGEGYYYLFGLRHTNPSLAGIIRTKKIVVAEAGAVNKEMIYRLGKQHRSALTAGSEWLGNSVPSREFGFPVPHWANGYSEINITAITDLGSQVLLWGKPVGTAFLPSPAADGRLYHIHFLRALYGRRRRNLFTPA